MGEPAPHQVLNILTRGITEFQELNKLGMTPAPACSKCMGCEDCTFWRKCLSKEEQEVVSRVEATMKVDNISGIISCVYPWKPCVTRMRSNRQQAQKIQESVERHMILSSTHQDFVKEVCKSIADGKVHEVDEDEIARWHGPVHYVTIFGVFKAGSVSTKTRVVQFRLAKPTLPTLFKPMQVARPKCVGRSSGLPIVLAECRGGPDARFTESVPGHPYFSHGPTFKALFVLRTAWGPVDHLRIHQGQFWRRGRWPDSRSGQKENSWTRVRN